MRKTFLAVIAAFLTCAATAQEVAVSAGHLQSGVYAAYTAGITTADQTKRGAWVTEWTATATQSGLHGVFASVGYQYRLAGFGVGVCGSLLLPVAARNEAEQQTRLHLSPVVSVRNGPAMLSVSAMPQVFPLARRMDVRVTAAYFLK